MKTYYKSVAENKDVSKFVNMLTSAVTVQKAEIAESLKRYSDYAFLWETDKLEAVQVIV